MDPKKQTLILTPKVNPKKPTLIVTRKAAPVGKRVPFSSLASKNPNKTA